MTLKETLKDLGLKNGLSESQADSILDQMGAEDIDGTITERWNDTAASYPSVLVGVLWMVFKRNAKDWLLQNCPDHFALTLFL